MYLPATTPTTTKAAAPRAILATAPVLRVAADDATVVGSVMVAPGRPETFMVVFATVGTVVAGNGSLATPEE